MAEFWFIDNQLRETPSVPAGYETGLIDEGNPAPKGAEVLKGETAIAGRIEKAEAAIVQALGGISSDVYSLDQSEFKEKYSVREVRDFADELGLPIKAGRGYIGEADLIVSIYKALGQE